MVSRFDVYLINLDDEISTDPKNTRPAVVVSPDELNRNIDTVIIAPLASTNVPYPTRVEVDFLNAKRFVILDQVRTVDKERLVKKIGSLERRAHRDVLDRLEELFAE
ncbi:MAG: type II toxin-antitoxin system PemK/MazF family toxin [Pyrinomonadaceae bacterium]